MKTIINVEDYLQKIDSYFLEKSQKDIYMTYFMLFAILFAFSYLLFWDSSEAAFKTKIAQVKSVEKNIQIDKQYLQANPKTKVQMLENDIKTITASIDQYKKDNQYIKSKIEEIAFLIYDEQTWGEYLHSISKNAVLYNIELLKLHNTFTDTNTTFGHVLDISLKSNGTYHNTINFINSLEQSDLVIDLHSLNIEATDQLQSDFNISVWGITY